METSSPKNVKFRLDIGNLNTSSNSKKLTLSSLEKTKTRSSKARLSRPSIFSSNNKVNNTLFSTRFDAYGNEIVKGSKKYKVSFIDNISSHKIAEVILIENSNDFQNNNDNINCQCSSFCFIF